MVGARIQRAPSQDPCHRRLHASPADIETRPLRPRGWEGSTRAPPQLLATRSSRDASRARVLPFTSRLVLAFETKAAFAQGLHLFRSRGHQERTEALVFQSTVNAVVPVHGHTRSEGA